MPTIVKTSKEADLRSLLGGFGNHLARWERLQAKWPAESPLILAYPNRILAQASIEWLVENVEGLRPVASYSGDERVRFEQEFLRVRGELGAILGADQLDEKLLPKFGIGVNTWASVLSGVRAGRPVFVVAEWGCGSADVDPAGPIQDITVPTRTSRNEATLAVVSGGIPFGPTRWKISAHDESPRVVEVGPEGRATLGEMAEGQKVVVEQEGLVYDVKNRQFFEMGSDPTVFKVEAHRQARVVVRHPKAADRSETMDNLQIDVGGQIRDFELRPDGRTEDGPYQPGGPWKLKGASGEVLAECVLKDGENIIDLMPEERVESIPPEVDELEEPVDDAPVPELTRFRLENGLRMAMRNQPFRLDFDGQAPALQLETGDEGHVDAVWPDGVSKATATTTIRDIERSIPLEHEPGTDQHTLRFGRRIPRWVWWTLAAIIALVFLMLLRVPYYPEIRIVDAETEAPISGATVFYSNLDGDVDLDAISDSTGVVMLSMGKRPLYQRIFQLNPPVPIEAYAPEYHPEQSTLDVRTWYWLQDWPLSPLQEGTVAIKTVNGSRGLDVDNKIPLSDVNVRARSLTRSGSPVIEGVSDVDGYVYLALDKREEYHLLASKPSYSSDSVVGRLDFLSKSPNNVLELWKLLPCDGEQNVFGQQIGDMRFDMKKAGAEFCFTCWNNYEYDKIQVFDGNDQLLYELKWNDDQANGGLGLTDDQSRCLAERVLIQTPTRYISVRVDGNTHWGFVVDCPGEPCQVGRCLGPPPPTQ